MISYELSLRQAACILCKLNTVPSPIILRAFSNLDIFTFDTIICDSTYQKVPVVGRLEFELWGCKVKISQNIVPKSILWFHNFGSLESSILNLKVTWRIWWVQKQCFNVKIDLWIDKIPILWFPNFKSLFLKINFSPICYDILNKIAISQEGNIRFQNFLHQNWDDRTAI